jgi:hypothetical protein
MKSGGNYITMIGKCEYIGLRLTICKAENEDCSFDLKQLNNCTKVEWRNLQGRVTVVQEKNNIVLCFSLLIS